MNPDTKTKTHLIADLQRSSLDAMAESRGLSFRSFQDNDYRLRLFDDYYKLELLHFPAGKRLHMHVHVPASGASQTPRPLFKILLKGRIHYQDGQEELLPMQLGVVDEGVTYSGEVLEDSILLLMTPSPAAIRYFDV